MISAPGCWSAGQITAPPRLEDIGTRVTIVVRRDVPETDNVVLIKVPAPLTLTVSPPATTTGAGPAALTALTFLSASIPTWPRYTASALQRNAAGDAARLTPGVATGPTAARLTRTAMMATSVLAPGLTRCVLILTSVRTTGTQGPPWPTVVRTRPAATATGPTPVSVTGATRTSRLTLAAATSMSALTPAGTPGLGERAAI